MRRSVLPPAMSLFDVTDRDNPHVGTDPTNTPLQALSLMNDVTALEAARMLAERMLTAGGPAAADRLGFRLPGGHRPATLRGRARGSF